MLYRRASQTTVAFLREAAEYCKHTDIPNAMSAFKKSGGIVFVQVWRQQTK